MTNYAQYLQPELIVSYCKLVTVTTEPRLESVEMRNGVAAFWPFLSDRKRTLLHELQFIDDSEHRFGPVYLPTTFVLDGDLTIFKVYDGWWYVGRPTVEELRMDLRAVMQRRADWAYSKDWSAGGLG